ncbi:hypothetical protein ACIHJG_26755 [Streptomyces sp. NPDC052415]|jgi:hypothetical protein|uniref:hypothetical protein n=1 Tax=unclassified Streptomyces TaxID=2593676 RepID=UPI00201FE13E|nr:hypothetical protein [Streptomyces sp. YS415]MCL7426560.1 hypothetical protein [Streptomyces sp. YS415]
MSVVIVFELPGMTQAQYEQCVERLTGRPGPMTSTSDWPVAGIVSHVAAPTSDGWLVVDVWESEEAFREFGETVVPILQDLGVPDAQPRIYPVLNAVTG